MSNEAAAFLRTIRVSCGTCRSCWRRRVPNELKWRRDAKIDAAIIATALSAPGFQTVCVCLTALVESFDAMQARSTNGRKGEMVQAGTRVRYLVAVFLQLCCNLASLLLQVFIWHVYDCDI